MRKVVNDRYQEILDWQSEPGEAEGGERRMLRMLKITVIDVQRLKEALDSNEPGAQADLDKARESWKGRELTSMRKCFTQVLSMVDSNGGMPFLRQGYYQRTGRQGSPRGRAKAETIDDCCEPVQDWAGAMRALALGANYGDADAANSTTAVVADLACQLLAGAADSRASDTKPRVEGRYATFLHYTHAVKREEMLTQIMEAGGVGPLVQGVMGAVSREQAKDLMVMCDRLPWASGKLPLTIGKR